MVALRDAEQLRRDEELARDLQKQFENQEKQREKMIQRDLKLAHELQTNFIEAELHRQPPPQLPPPLQPQVVHQAVRINHEPQRPVILPDPRVYAQYVRVRT